MEFEHLHINLHPHALGQNIRDIEYSASADQQIFWARLRDHTGCSRQAFLMVKGGPHDEAQSQQPIPQISEPPTHVRRRERSPQESPDSSPKRRRSQRLESQHHDRNVQSRADSSPRASPQPSLQPVANSSTHEDPAIPIPESISGHSKIIAKSSTPESIPSGTITIALNRRPPLQVRIKVAIPRFVVRVTITGANTSDLDSNPDIGTLHAVVSLWSADGRVACPHAVPPLLSGHKDATLISVPSADQAERRVEATFSDLAITRPGHYRIRMSIMETPLPDAGDENDSAIGSPRQLLSIETRPIYAHSFAPVS